MRISSHFGFDRCGKQCSLFQWAISLLLLLVCACGNNAQQESGISERAVTTRSAVTSVSAAPACREAAGKTAVSIAWKQALGGGTVKQANDLLVAQVVNNTRVAQQGTVVATAIGLDGQRAERPVGTFNLAAGATQDVSVPMSALPVQSEVALSFAVLQVELAGPVGSVRPSSTRQVYYIYSGGYTQAELYTSDEVLTIPDHGLRTADPMDVRGRVLDAQGAVQEVNASSATLGMAPRQGLSLVNAAPSKLSYANGVPEIVASGNSAPTPMTSVSEVLYFYWSVNYADSGLGEDVWSAPWPQVPATYAAMWITDTNWQTTYYYGELNELGSTGHLDLPASTNFYATIWTFARDTNYTTFVNMIDPGGGPGILSVTIPFTTGSSGGFVELVVPFNDEAVQTAAVASKILYDEFSSPGSRGITPGSIFNIYSNTGCPTYGDLVSCYDGPITNGQASIYYGPQSGGNQETGAWWKFLIAHEIGHAVQDFGSGIPSGSPYTLADPSVNCVIVTVFRQSKGSIA